MFMKRSLWILLVSFLCSCAQELRNDTYAPDVYWNDGYSGKIGIQVGQNALTGDPEMTLADIPLYVTGVNCYNLFVQSFEADGMQTSRIEETVKRLAAEKVPVVRFSCTPFYPHQMHFYTEQKESYLANLKKVAELCDEHHILLIPSFIWQTYCLPEYFSEPHEALGNKDSKTFGMILEITRDIVSTLKDHKCVAAWEYGNEANLQADTWIEGYPKITAANLEVALKAFGETVQSLDPSGRLICTGHGCNRSSQWNIFHNQSWERDTYDQFVEMVGMMTPEPIKGMSEHVYEDVRELADMGPLTKNQSIRVAKEAAAKNGKVYYIGEFTGMGGGDSLLVKQAYESIVMARVQLSLQWNYALEGDIEYSFSADTENGRKAFELMRRYNEKLMLMNLTENQIAQANHLKLASIFTDHAVLQRDASVPVWGWAKPGKKVKIFTSWNKTTTVAKTDETGRWRVNIQTPAAGGPHSMRISGQGESIELHDILSGEVWLCSGQSNMGLTVAGFGAQNPDGAVEDVLEANEYSDRIRLYNIRDRKEFSPQETLNTSWSKSDAFVTANSTAVGYKFAKRLTKLLGVPVGIIDNSWGGSLIEPWLSEEWYTTKVKPQMPAGNYLWHVSQREKATNDPIQIGTMFNTRMYPIKGYGIRGFLWYQGCGNRGGYGFYDNIQKEMVKNWREAWGDTENKLPFYFTTIAPFHYWDAPKTQRGYFVENQLASLDSIPNSGAAITETLGEEGNIHPSKKQEIADQFILMAAEDVYHVPTGLGSGFPRPSEVVFPAGSSVEEKTIHQSGFDLKLRRGESDEKVVKVYFANAPLGMMKHSEMSVPVIGFEVAGPDRKFRPVKASCLNACVTLDCSAVANPVAVRYAFYNYSDSNLLSSMGIPVPSFRTDDWPEQQ